MESNSSRPKISVLMPVYNVKDYLRTAVESVLNQTLSDIELICVDDASTDGSADILREYAARDSRVKLVFHQKNSGLVAARKSATDLARGEYIMLLDSDDKYTPDACETVWKEEQANPVDILQFGTEAVICREHDFQEKEDLQKVLTPYHFVKGDLVTCCYAQHLWNHTVWNKAYRSSVWKTALQYAVDAYINISEDEYLFFLVSIFSTTYRGIAKKLYHYSYARGMTGAMGISARQFEPRCKRRQVYLELKQFLQQINRPDLAPVCDQMEREALEVLLREWRYHVAVSQAKPAYQCLLSVWGAVAVISEMARLFWSDMQAVADRLAPDTSPTPETAGQPVHTIGVFYHRMGNGGVERVISYLIPLWKEMGYSVVLITEAAPTADDYEVPSDVPWVQLPDIASCAGKAYHLRAEGWTRIIAEHHIDTIVYNTANVVPLWDVCLLKGLACHFVVDIHSTFSSLYLLNDPNRFFYAQCYRLVDRVATLSRVFVRYWGNFCPAYYIPNPTGPLCDAGECSPLSGRNLLWVGRISPEKRPFDAIRIFQQIHARFPDATLTMVGKGESKEDLEDVKAFAHRLGVDESIDFAGYHKDVAPYYQRADLLLFTSQYEGFPLVLLESKMHGVPIVMYDLPYVELVRDGAGVFAAPQEDLYAMTDLITRLFENRDLLQQAGREARNSLSAYDTEHLKEKWYALFNSLAVPADLSCPDEDQRLMMNLLLESEATAISRSPSGGTHFVDAPMADRLIRSKFMKIAAWYWKHTDPLKERIKRMKKKVRR